MGNLNPFALWSLRCTEAEGMAEEEAGLDTTHLDDDDLKSMQIITPDDIGAPFGDEDDEAAMWLRENGGLDYNDRPKNSVVSQLYTRESFAFNQNYLQSNLEP